MYKKIYSINISHHKMWELASSKKQFILWFSTYTKKVIIINTFKFILLLNH